MGKLGYFILSALVLALAGNTTAFSQTPAWQQHRLGLTAYGPVAIGMTVPQASKALGVPIQSLKGTTPDPDPNACKILWPNGDSKSPISFMVTNGRISRVDALKPPTKTMSGAAVGITEGQLKTIYPNLKMQANKYDPQGHDFIYQPVQDLYKPYSLIFQTNGQTVKSFRAGKKEEVGYLEACS